jgi:hypothetical protein
MIQEFFLRIRRAESPGYCVLKKLVLAIISFNLPLPRFALAFYRMLYAVHNFCFQAVSRLPYIVGHAKSYVGDDVNLFGKVDIVSGASFESRS